MTMLQIKNQIIKIISEGNKIDIVLIDYIDCVVPDRGFSDEWKGEGLVMRQFETMISELDVVGWTAIQGNRSSIQANVVQADMIGGSIKKGQIGHFILSIAKTLEQKEAGTATLAILKSRFGKDGVIFEDCTFNNSKVYIDTKTSETFLGYERKSEEKKEEKARERIKRAKELRQSRTQ